jgi:ANTAR domain
MAEQEPHVETPLEHLVHHFTQLSSEEILEIVESRVVIERVKGMLMFIYDIDADKAFELLKWRSQETNVKLRLIAEQLLHDLAGIARREVADMQSECDNLLLTVHERVPAHGHRPNQGEG